MTSPGFTYAGPRGTQVACDVCGRRGYDRNLWQDVCRRGHLPCSDCGRRLAVRLDGSARVHTRCPNRPEETT